MSKEDSEKTEYIKELVKQRLSEMPPDVSFSIGEFGDFTPDELIAEVDRDSEVGKAVIDMEITFIRKMPRMMQAAK
jgi:hypothetical protein